jgi:hypothetical protein
MTAIAVFKVDDLGRRPLLISGVGGLVSLHPSPVPASNFGIFRKGLQIPKPFTVLEILEFYGFHDSERISSAQGMLDFSGLICVIVTQVLSLFLLGTYYFVGQGYSILAVIALLIYVSCYQVKVVWCKRKRFVCTRNRIEVDATL